MPELVYPSQDGRINYVTIQISVRGAECSKAHIDNMVVQHRKHKKKVRSIKKSKLPKGFKHIPSNLKVHFPKDHVLLVIDSDGACGISGGAAHIFADKSQGKALRREVNRHIVKHWTYYQNKINFPFDRQVGVSGERVNFSDPRQYLDYLLTPAADLLWTDSEEVQALCNMYQMSAVVIKVVGGKDDPPSILQVGPDQDIMGLGLPDTAMVGRGTVPTMFLLLQGGHYDLAVPEVSIKEKYLINVSDGDDEEEVENTKSNEPQQTTEEKLSDMEKKYELLKQAYTESLGEIRSLKVKLEGQKQESNETAEGTDNSEENLMAKSKSLGFKKTSPQSEPELKLTCEVCGKTFHKPSTLNKHIESHKTDGDWTCKDCSFQTYSQDNLKIHKQKAHPVEGNEQASPASPRREGDQGGRQAACKRRGNQSNTCNNCKKDFVYKIDLAKHVRENHRTFKPCRNLKNCSYGERCSYNHRKYPDGSQVCYECGNYYKTLHELMKHRKQAHIVPMCKEFMRKHCDFSSEDCYYVHTSNSQPEIPYEELQEPNQSQSESLGFWAPPSNLAPPLSASLPGPSQAEWTKMKLMLSELNQLVAQFK